MSDLNAADNLPLADDRRNFGIVCFTLTCVFIVHSMLLVTVPVHAVNLGASPLLLGVIFSTPYFLPLVVAIPLGSLVTRHGGRASMLSGAFLLILGLVTILVVAGYLGLIAGLLFFGLAQLQMVLAAQTIISSLGSGPRLERYFGWYTTWLSGGQIVGPLLAGILMHTGGITTSSYAGMLTIALCSLAAIPFLAGQAIRSNPINWSSVGFKAQARLLRTNPAVKVSLAVTGTATFAMIIHGNYLPVLLEDLEVTATTIGFLVSLRAVAAMLIRPVLASAIDYMGGRGPSILISIACLSAGLVFMGATDSIIMIAAFSVLVGLGSGLCQPLSIVILSESVDSTQRAGALGTRLMTNRGVNFIAPLLFGAVLEVGGFGFSFALSGIALGACGMLVLSLLRRSHRS